VACGKRSQGPERLCGVQHRFIDCAISCGCWGISNLTSGIVANQKRVWQTYRSTCQSAALDDEQHSGGVSKDACVHQLFEAQVKRTPNAIAVVLGDEQLTYWALNQPAPAIICNNWESLQKSW